MISRIPRYLGIFALLLLLSPTSCGRKSMITIPALSAFETDSIGTRITAADGATEVGWSAPRRSLVFGRVVGYVPCGHDCTPPPDIGVAEADPVTGQVGPTLVHSGALVWWLSPGGRYVIEGSGNSAVELGGPASVPGIWSYPDAWTRVYSPGDSLIAYHLTPVSSLPGPNDSVFVRRWLNDPAPRYAGPGRPQVFSPDSHQLLVHRYSSDNFHFTSFVVDIATRDSLQVTTAPFPTAYRRAVIWDAAGIREYFWVDSQLLEWQPLTGTTTLIHNGPGESFQPTNPYSLNVPDDAVWPVPQIATSIDGSMMAFATAPYSGIDTVGVTLWLVDRRTGVVSRLIHGHNITIDGASFSPDGRKLAATVSGRLYLLGIQYSSAARPVSATPSRTGRHTAGAAPRSAAAPR